MYLRTVMDATMTDVTMMDTTMTDATMMDATMTDTEPTQAQAADQHQDTGIAQVQVKEKADALTERREKWRTERVSLCELHTNRLFAVSTHVLMKCQRAPRYTSHILQNH